MPCPPPRRRRHSGGSPRALVEQLHIAARGSRWSLATMHIVALELRLRAQWFANHATSRLYELRPPHISRAHATRHAFAPPQPHAPGCVRTHVCVRVCEHTRRPAPPPPHTHRVCTWLCACVCVCVHMCMCVCVCVCVHMCKYAQCTYASAHHPLACPPALHDASFAAAHKQLIVKRRRA